MTKEFYDNLDASIRGNEKKQNTLKMANNLITRGTYIVYPVMLNFMIWQHHPLLLRAILVPAISFVIVSVIRRIINAPRPYEVFEREAIIDRKDSGQSFPSRHVFSIFVIGFTAFMVVPILGAIIFIAGVILCAIRVVGGVHFVKDVVAGAICGIAAGIIGFIII